MMSWFVNGVFTIAPYVITMAAGIVLQFNPVWNVNGS